MQSIEREIVGGAKTTDMLPLVITIEGREGTRRYAFADSPIRIGRSPFAELQLTEPYVSRWEGTLRFDENQVTYFPVSVTNPTYVDGKVAPGQEEVELGPESVLAIGGFTLRFAREPVAEADLRRKGKRQPVDSAGRVEAATVWLDARVLLGGSDLHAPEAGPSDTARPPQQQAHEAPALSPGSLSPMSTLTGAHREVRVFDREPPVGPSQTSRSSDSIRMLGSVRVSPNADPALTHETKIMERPPSTRPSAASGSGARTIMMRSGDSSAPPRAEGAQSSRPPPPGSVPPRASASGFPGSPTTPPPPVGSPAELYQSYRQAFRALFE
ncbi:MAG: hypothetical protein JWN04_5968, partial [Myxococcaceae bacterium]|nr:hypothetical protein [Myxococcaceae bacterium]